MKSCIKKVYRLNAVVSSFRFIVERGFLISYFCLSHVILLNSDDALYKVTSKAIPFSLTHKDRQETSVKFELV